MIRANGTVVTFELNRHLHLLDPPARFCGVVYLAIQTRPVRHTAVKTSNENKIEVVLLMSPLARAVVNGESAVWRYPGWLDWAEVDTQDIRAGVCVCEIHGPDPGPASQVYHIPAFLVDGG